MKRFFAYLFGGVLAVGVLYAGFDAWVLAMDPPEYPRNNPRTFWRGILSWGKYDAVKSRQP